MPFTARQAERHGLGRHALRDARWRRLTHGVWIDAQAPVTRETWLAAARLIMPVDAVFCLHSAAESHGVSARALADTSVHVAFTDRVPRKRAGMAIRELLLTEAEVVSRDGWLVTTPIRTAFDCARLLRQDDAVIITDALCHNAFFTPAALCGFADRHPGIRFVSRVRIVTELAEPLTESPMESRMRLAMVRGGLPRPTAQLVIHDHAGRFVARADFGYEAARLVVEYDGALHWEQRRHDDRRRDRLRALGWTVLVFSAEDLRQPALLVTRINAALLRAAA
jgi:hypothetical protein